MAIAKASKKPELKRASARSAVAKGRALVGIIMGSQSDWETMRHAADDRWTSSASPMRRASSPPTARPRRMFDYAESAAARGLKVIIAGAGGAAHLPGMTAALTALPVLGVPVESAALKGLDSLLSIVQMPAGIPVGTLAIGRAGAINAACWRPRSWRSPTQARSKLARLPQTQTAEVAQTGPWPIGKLRYGSPLTT